MVVTEVLLVPIGFVTLHVKEVLQVEAPEAIVQDVAESVPVGVVAQTEPVHVVPGAQEAVAVAEFSNVVLL